MHVPLFKRGNHRLKKKKKIRYAVEKTKSK